MDSDQKELMERDLKEARNRLMEGSQRIPPDGEPEPQQDTDLQLLGQGYVQLRDRAEKIAELADECVNRILGHSKPASTEEEKTPLGDAPSFLGHMDLVQRAIHAALSRIEDQLTRL